MTAFDRAFEKTVGIEGGYSNRPGDPGGETWRGISRRHWPEWEGWRLIDRLKRNRAEFPESLEHDLALATATKAFYLANFWAALRCGEMPEPVAFEVFDTAVNTGRLAAAYILQGTLAIAGSELDIDGRIGRETIAALNRIGGDAALEQWPGAQLGYYVCLAVKVNPALRENLNGWIRKRARP